MPARQYRVYGLTLAAPLSLPIPPAPASTRTDVRFHPAQASEFPRRTGRPRGWFDYRALSDGSAHLEWRGLFEFLVSPDGGTVRYRRLPGATDRSLGTYLLGHVVSFSLVARGAEPLHGTAVAVGGDAVVFLGDCGEGKSTLGAAMVQRGARVVSDDLIAIRRRGRACFVQPGPARLKLYRRVARAIVGRRHEWQMHRDTAKLVVPVRAQERARHQVRLRAFYVLARPQPGRRRSEIRVDTLSPGSAVVELLRASFNLTVNSPERERARFALASELARTVPVKRLTYPRSLAMLPKVCDAVLRDLKLLNPTNPLSI
jgi:hypothetical protein